MIVIKHNNNVRRLIGYSVLIDGEEGQCGKLGGYMDSDNNK